MLLCDIPQGRTGRPSKSLTLAQAEALLAAAEGTSTHAYIVVSLLIGARTEELRPPPGLMSILTAARRSSWSGVQSVLAAIPRLRSHAGH